MARKRKVKKKIEALTHGEESRLNIPTAELESVMSEGDKTPLQIAYERRNRDLDPQLVWHGKDQQNDADLVVQAPPLYIQEKIHPKALIDDLSRASRERAEGEEPEIPDLFADFNGLPNLEAKAEFYQHAQNWSNRMILGDSLQVMASLTEREGLRGKVQCIYMDPPYGIKFNSNFQWSTTSRDVRDGRREHITREPEQVKAFRDTWRDGIHSYLTYLRDRLTVSRELLSESGSIFVQIGDANLHLVRVLMDEVFGKENFVSVISVRTTTGFKADFIGNVSDFIIWYAKNREKGKYRPPRYRKEFELGQGNARWLMFEHGFYRGVSKEEVQTGTHPSGAKPYEPDNLLSQGRASSPQPFEHLGCAYDTWDKNSHWKANYPVGMERLARAGRLHVAANSIRFVRYHTDFELGVHSNIWTDTGTGNFTADKVFVVQSNEKTVQRCMLMVTDPGDLVLDPTCGSGTTAYVAEHWGRRWITIDTSRVALALARARVMGARYPYYVLADSRDGQLKEAELSRKAPSNTPTYGDVRQGFVYERVPHITLKAIANNTEVDLIYEGRQLAVDAALKEINKALRGHSEPFPITAGGRKGSNLHFDAPDDSTVALPTGESVPEYELLEWEVPHEVPDSWPKEAAAALERFWVVRIARQREIDASIATHAEFEYLYDKPYEDKSTVRVAGPFTVESLTPHRVAEMAPSHIRSTHDNAKEYDAEEAQGVYLTNQPAHGAPEYDFRAVILEQLRTAGVQQADKRGRIDFTSLTGWPGNHICSEGRYLEGEILRRAGILVGPEHGTVGRGDLMAAAREAGDAGFDVLIACAFNYDAQSTDVNKLGRLPILKARMNADLHMSTDLKKTKGGNLFVIFGEPDIEVVPATDDRIQVKIKGVDLFDPRTGDICSSETEDLACWFIDTDYDMASFFVRHAYFLGANDPYKSLKTTLRAEIDAEAWQSLRSDTSRPFKKPKSGRIAVKAINHLGDEAMKVVDVA